MKINRESIQKLLAFAKSQRGELKKSRYKIWLRAFLLVQFSAIFTFYFIEDIHNGHFTWEQVATFILIFIPIGFLMSKLVPMKADKSCQAVTFSLDKIYLFLIWFLVISKLLASYRYHAPAVSDVIMAAIIGLMFGRLGGIGMRVRHLKQKHDFI